MNESDLKIAIVVNKDSAMWAPVHIESHLLPVLEQILQSMPEDIRARLPAKDAIEFLQSILGNLHINWEDIPDPGLRGIRRN